MKPKSREKEGLKIGGDKGEGGGQSSLMEDSISCQKKRMQRRKWNIRKKKKKEIQKRNVNVKKDVGC